MALVAIAGPLTNLVLAFLGFLIGYFSGALYTTGIAQAIFANFVTINLGFFVFNILPIPPLDGSRLLYVIAPDKVREVMQKIEATVGVWLVFGLILVFSSALSKLMTGAITGILEFFLMIVGAS